MSNLNYLDDNEKQEYHDGYLKAMGELTSGLEDDARDVLFEEMQTIRYNPTDDPRQDAELNMLRVEKIVAAKKKLGGPVASSLKHKARDTSGKKAA